MRTPPEVLCTLVWPGKAHNQPPIFYLKAKGAEDLGTLLGCLNAWGEYYGAVQLRFPTAITSGTGPPSSWFPKTKQGTYAKIRPTTRTENVIPIGSAQGILVNEFNKTKWTDTAPLSDLLPMLEKAYQTGDYGLRTIPELWNSFYGGGQPGTYRVDIDGMKFRFPPGIAVSIQLIIY